MRHLFFVGVFSMLLGGAPGIAQEAGEPIPQSVVDAAIRSGCGAFRTISSSGSPGGLAAASERNEIYNAKVRDCIRSYDSRLRADQRSAQKWQAIPAGEKSGASINGQPIRKCSHGGLCQSDILRGMGMYD